MQDREIRMRAIQAAVSVAAPGDDIGNLLVHAHENVEREIHEVCRSTAIVLKQVEPVEHRSCPGRPIRHLVPFQVAAFRVWINFYVMTGTLPEVEGESPVTRRVVQAT